MDSNSKPQASRLRAARLRQGLAVAVQAVFVEARTIVLQEKREWVTGEKCRTDIYIYIYITVIVISIS